MLPCRNSHSSQQREGPSVLALVYCLPISSRVNDASCWVGRCSCQVWQAQFRLRCTFSGKNKRLLRKLNNLQHVEKLLALLLRCYVSDPSGDVLPTSYRAISSFTVSQDTEVRMTNV